MIRRLLVVVVTLCGAATLSAQGNLLSTLRATAEQVQDSVFNTLIWDTADIPYERSGLKAASDEQRVALVRAAFSLARTLTGNAAFARRYAEFREERRPERAETARTGDEARMQQQQAMEQAIKQAVANAAQLPAEQRKQLEESIAEMRKQIAELNADPDYQKAVDDTAKAQASAADAEYEQKLAAFSAEYPDDVNALIARRLRQFLLACGDVDFAAKVEPDASKRLKFVNPAYERRSREWKMCYRAGKPAVEAARAAANDWLKVIAP